MNRPTFEDGVAVSLARDPRYKKDAYAFDRDALDHTLKQQMESGQRRTPGHVAGPELLAGARDHALDLFGPLSRAVLESWGVHTTGDLGHIVFNLIETGVFSQSRTDQQSDFDGVFDFEEVFDLPFRPKAARKQA